MNFRPTMIVLVSSGSHRSLLQPLLPLLLTISMNLAESMSITPTPNNDAMAMTHRSTPSSPSSSSFSLGASTLRKLALAAAAKEEEEDQVVDLIGIQWLEHINLLVGSKSVAEYFYQDFLGFTRDPSARFHVNLGQQQFHLDAVTDEPAQIICGSIGLVVPSLRSVRRRLDDALMRLHGTHFRVIAGETENDPNNNQQHQSMTVSCPFGNILHIYGLEEQTMDQTPPRATTATADAVTPANRPKMVQLHARGGLYNHAARLGVRGGQQPGICYIEIACPFGTAAAIGRFYEQMVGCTVHYELSCPASSDGDDDTEHIETTSAVVAVSAGSGVHIFFVEVAKNVDGSDIYRRRLQQMKGVHICVYTAPQFRELYQRLANRGLVWTNPRFIHLDCCDTLTEALASRTLRFKDIIDLNTGQVILELEHETRPTRHGQYLKVPFYEAR